MKIGDRLLVMSRGYGNEYHFITVGTVTEEVDDSYENHHNGDWVNSSYFKVQGDDGRSYNNQISRDSSIVFLYKKDYLKSLGQQINKLQAEIAMIKGVKL